MMVLVAMEAVVAVIIIIAIAIVVVVVVVKIKMSNAVSSNITRELLLTTTSSSKAYVPSTWLEVYAIANGDATQPHLQAEMNRKSDTKRKLIAVPGRKRITAARN